jgi:hypothetical protein
VIALSKGSYVPRFKPNTATTDQAAETPSARGRFRRFAANPVVAWACGIGGVAIAVIAWLPTRSAQQHLLPTQFEVELESDGLLASDVGTTVVAVRTVSDGP